MELGVSIHAPAGGATHDGGALLIGKGVSIHAPAGGATRMVARGYAPDRVSIHAPAGGATVTRFVGESAVQSFNPRARGGRDYFSVSL